MPCLLPGLLPTPHILLKPVKRPGLLLTLRIRLGPPIELPINQRPLISDIAQRLRPILIEHNLIAHVIFEYLRPQLLLELVNLKAF